MAKGLNRKERGQRRKTALIDEVFPAPKNKHLEKKARVYIVAHPDSGQYLYKKPGSKEYRFFKDVAKATKAEERSMAHFLIECYYEDTRDNLDLVVIPLEITYELINEFGEYDYDMDINAEIMRWDEWKKKLN